MCILCLQGPLLMDQPVSALAWQLQLAHSLPLLQVGTSNCYFSCSDAAGIMSLFGMLFESFWHFSGVGAMTKMRQPHDSHPFMQTSSKFQASIQASQCNQHRRHSFTSPSVLRQNQHVSLRSGCWNNLVFWITTCNSSLAPRHRWSLRTLSTTKKLTKGTNLNAVTGEHKIPYFQHGPKISDFMIDFNFSTPIPTASPRQKAQSTAASQQQCCTERSAALPRIHDPHGIGQTQHHIAIVEQKQLWLVNRDEDVQDVLWCFRVNTSSCSQSENHFGFQPQS